MWPCAIMIAIVYVVNLDSYLVTNGECGRGYWNGLLDSPLTPKWHKWELNFTLWLWISYPALPFSTQLWHDKNQASYKTLCALYQDQVTQQQCCLHTTIVMLCVRTITTRIHCLVHNLLSWANRKQCLSHCQAQTVGIFRYIFISSCSYTGTIYG